MKSFILCVLIPHYFKIFWLSVNENTCTANLYIVVWLTVEKCIQLYTVQAMLYEQKAAAMYHSGVLIV